MENVTEQQNFNTMSYKEWALTIFLASIPIIGLILVLIWAFDSGTRINKKNWAKGMLLLMVIYFLIIIMFLFMFGGIALLAGMS